MTPSFNVASDKKKLDYGDFVILKTYIQLDSFQGLVSNLEKNHTINISDFTVKIENDIQCYLYLRILGAKTSFHLWVLGTLSV